MCIRDSVMSEDFMSNIENEFNLLFISGMTNKVTSEKYISLENILNTKNLDYLLSGLSQYFSNDETQTLLDNLLHNFSLENIIANLSILDGRISVSYTHLSATNTFCFA